MDAGTVETLGGGFARKDKVTIWGFAHADGCPAVDDVLIEALRAWAT